jgi:hypothetical protein
MPRLISLRRLVIWLFTFLIVENDGPKEIFLILVCGNYIVHEVFKVVSIPGKRSLVLGHPEKEVLERWGPSGRILASSFYMAILHSVTGSGLSDGCGGVGRERVGHGDDSAEAACNWG